MGKFSLAEHIAKGVVPNLGTNSGREQIEYIDMDRIDDDPNNFYELSGLQELAANIELLGLQQPIRVRPGGEQGRYVIVSGHRRRAAVRQLVEDGHEELRDLPCIVEQGQESAALQELRLIYANSDTRRLTSPEISRQAERVEALLYQLKEEGYEFPGRMRDHVAEACRVSKSKLSRLKVIRENLNPGWRGRYESGSLSESSAYTLAQMPEKRQMVLLAGLGGREKLYEGELASYGRSLEQTEKVTCKRQGGWACTNREAMQERILHDKSWSYNYCQDCCENCPNLAGCKRACPMLAERVKQLKSDARAEKQREKQAREEKARPKAEAIQGLWRRFGDARAAAGKTVEECCRAVIGFYSSESDSEYEKFERLEKNIDENTRVPYGPNYYLDVIQRCVKAADLLGVPLDYLLCRTDDPAGLAPAPEGQLMIAGWMPGGTVPFQPCDVVADFDVGDGVISRIVCRFDGKGFRFRNNTTIDAQAVRWMTLPPVGDGKEKEL